MHHQLNSYITAYGGKAGVLQLLHDHYPKLRPYLSPARIIPHGGEITQKIYKALLDSRRSFGSPDILVRASHHKDWFGLVDFLPTIRVPDPDRERSSGLLNNNRKEFQDVLDYSIANSFNTHNQKYAKALHYLLVPYIKHTLYTITEHPNQPNYLFVDTGEMGTFYGRSIVDVVGDTIIGIEGHTDVQAIRKTTSLIGLLRKLKIFKEEDKLQYEIAITENGKPYVFQVRKFADTFATLPKEITANHSIIHKSRIMGALSTEQVLYHQHGSDLDEIEMAIDYTYGENLLFSCDLCSSHITFEQPPLNLKGFVSESQLALFHNLTAPSQATLQNGGFVLLKATPPRYDAHVKMHIDGQGIYRSRANLKT